MTTPRTDATTLAQLIESFPLTFVPFGQPPKVLKIGIAADIRAAAVSIGRKRLKRALSAYCAQYLYRAAHIAGAPRVDLTGSIVDVVTTEQVASAKAGHDRRQAKAFESVLRSRREWRERKAAERKVATSNATPIKAPSGALSLAGLKAAALARKAAAA